MARECPMKGKGKGKAKGGEKGKGKGGGKDWGKGGWNKGSQWQSGSWGKATQGGWQSGREGKWGSEYESGYSSGWDQWGQWNMHAGYPGADPQPVPVPEAVKVVKVKKKKKKKVQLALCDRMIKYSKDSDSEGDHQKKMSQEERRKLEEREERMIKRESISLRAKVRDLLAKHRKSEKARSSHRNNLQYGGRDCDDEIEADREIREEQRQKWVKEKKKGKGKKGKKGQDSIYHDSASVRCAHLNVEAPATRSRSSRDVQAHHYQQAQHGGAWNAGGNWQTDWNA